jgi:Protein of unknown function (DUF1559)
MDAITSIADEIHFISDDPAPSPRARAVWRIVRWGVVAGIAGLAATLIVAGTIAEVRESRRKQCHTNLRRLGLAFHEYHEAHNRFPAPAIASRDGRPLLSWRVALLPHLGYQSLYARFHLDEPWASPHNRPLLAEMPPELACPAGNGRRDGMTRYLVVVGPGIDTYSVNTPFNASRGAEIREMTDGASNTVLAIESEALVPWTKPDDLHWAPGGPLPRMISPHADGTHVLLADGSARFLKQTIPSQFLLALLTINGGEVFSGLG